VADAGGNEAQVVPDGSSSGWAFNWWGLVGLVVIVSIALIAWRWIEGTGTASSETAGAAVTSDPDDSPTTTSQSSRTTTTTRPAPATTSPSSTTTVPSERRVIIRGEMKACRFGANCLVASFRIDGFDPHPGSFTCIYPNSRSDFTFRNNGIEDACLTADAGDTITIEVDGVQSATISENNLDGT
jgi:hypothetical protein